MPMPKDSARNFEDTIAAIATAPGFGGVGIIRLSGPQSHSVLRALFRPSNPNFSGFKPWRMHHGHIVAAPQLFAVRSGSASASVLGTEEPDQNLVIDEVLAVVMLGPRSFTGEDVAEIHCHGGPAILQAVLAAALEEGARLALPGEFTRRAFLNGRIDLTQAEAVAECIAAPAAPALLAAQGKLQGALGHCIDTLRDRLLQLRSELTLAVDFPEEELEIAPLENLAANVQEAARQIDELLAAQKRMRYWREGALAVIAGQVNVGKSSLLNALLGRNRAIVSALPGTTRDFLEEQINLDGLPLRLVDTAGLRQSTDEAEEEGLRRASTFCEQADVILLVLDKERGPSDYERDLLAKFGPDKILGVANKCDLPARGKELWPAAQTEERYNNLQQQILWFDVSAKFGQGLSELTQALRAKILAKSGAGAWGDGKISEASWSMTPNLRQARILELARAEISGLQEDIANQIPCDLLGVRLELLCAILGEVTGEIAPEDVLDRIFAEFCLGK